MVGWISPLWGWGLDMRVAIGSEGNPYSTPPFFIRG